MGSVETIFASSSKLGYRLLNIFFFEKFLKGWQAKPRLFLFVFDLFFSKALISAFYPVLRNFSHSFFRSLISLELENRMN